jgi:hypothetical protein
MDDAVTAATVGLTPNVVTTAPQRAKGIAAALGAAS